MEETPINTVGHVLYIRTSNYQKNDDNILTCSPIWVVIPEKIALNLACVSQAIS